MTVEVATLEDQLKNLLTTPDGLESVFAQQNGRQLWADLVVMEPSRAFDEIMGIEDRLLQDDASFTSEELFVVEKTLREMHSIFSAAHPQCDWPILSDIPIVAPFYTH